MVSGDAIEGVENSTRNGDRSDAARVTQIAPDPHVAGCGPGHRRGVTEFLGRGRFRRTCSGDRFLPDHNDNETELPMWSNFFAAGGWGMYPTMIFGFFLLATTVL